MDDDRRAPRRQPGRRFDDILAYEVLEAVEDHLREQGYLTVSAGDNRYVTRAGRAFGEDRAVKLIGLVLVVGQFVNSILITRGR